MVLNREAPRLRGSGVAPIQLDLGQTLVKLAQTRQVFTQQDSDGGEAEEERGENKEVKKS